MNIYSTILHTSASSINNTSLFTKKTQKRILGLSLILVQTARCSLLYFTSYKKRVLCYLLSHVDACTLVTLKISLLKSVAELSSPLKSKMLGLSVQSLYNEQSAIALSTRFGNLYEEYAVLLASSFDVSAAEGMNEVDGVGWTTYLQLVKHFFRSGGFLLCKRQG